VYCLEELMMFRPVFSSPRTLTAGVLLSLALIGTSGVVRAEDDTKPTDDPFQAAIKRMERMLDQMEKRGALAFPDGFGPMARLRSAPGDGRLGVEVAKPSPALADQLDLPEGEGLVVRAVKPDSAAAKAGVKEHDILLELNGQPVPDEASKFAKLVAKAEAKKPMKAVVMRKGRKQTLEGLTLPEAKPAERAELPDFRFPEDFRRLLPVGVGNGNVTTLTRHDDTFTATQKDARGTVTVRGKVADGKASVEKVTVDDGDQKKTYDSVDAVPAEQRERVNKLLRMAEGGRVQKE
jgi:membrane-associated protease RseP (regulator of RpoE activity)